MSGVVVIATSITGFTLNNDPVTYVFYASLGVLCLCFLIIVICGALWQRAFNEHLEVMRSLGYE